MLPLNFIYLQPEYLNLLRNYDVPKFYLFVTRIFKFIKISGHFFYIYQSQSNQPDSGIFCPFFMVSQPPATGGKIAR